jgi:membrane protein implicated in regulation of membrane protease activity
MNVAVGIVLIAVIAVGVVFMINGIGIFDPSRKPNVQDDPEVINGLIARVTAVIAPAAAGAVTYTIQGVRHDVSARSVDGAAIQAGAEVVIERIEGGTAFVERWEAVEGRI